MEFEEVKTILSRHNALNSWFGLDYNMNLYRGCNHGCIYCDSRSSCYQVFDFDRVRGKKDSLKILETELSSKRLKGVVGIGAMSDPYNPLEEKYKLTREGLKLIDRYGFGISIATKSNLILRDMDILKSIARHSPVLIKMTITNWDDELSKIIEPRVSKSSERFAAIGALNKEGIYTGIIFMPVLPFISDTEENIKNIVDLGYKVSTKFIYPYFGVTLRGNQRNWFYDKLDLSFPGLKEKYIESYGDSYRCDSKNAKELYELFYSECENKKIIYKMKDIIEDYKRPYDIEQLSLF